MAINKNKIWFLTLFSLILVLSIYYVTMPSELLMTNNKNKDKDKPVVADVDVKESDILVALRVESERQLQDDIDDLKMILTSIESTIEEKNNAFNSLKELNVIRSKEEEIESKILKEFQLKSFVKITGTQIRVVVAKEEHDAKIANNIMRSVQTEFDKKMTISVKFQK